MASASAAEFYVGASGFPMNSGTRESPWDLESTLQGKQKVQPGDTIWIAGGTYKHPDRKAGAMGFAVRLAGAQGKPIEVRALPGEHVTLDGGLNVQTPATHIWLRDLEILVSENLTRSRRFEEPGSSPKSYDRPWGGLNVYSGAQCKFINLIIHDNAQGVSWWSASKDSELHGCIIYDNGWEAPDRGHGHAIYTQNLDGTKTISDCIMTGGYGYTLHAYGSSRADVNNYFVVGSICYSAGPFLIGSGKPSHNIKVFTNFLYGVSARLGYNAPYNEDCEVRGNVVADAELAINKYRTVVNEDNLVLAKNSPRPNDTKIILRANRYDPKRAHLVVFNWDKSSVVEIRTRDFLKKGESFRILNPRDLFGRPVFQGKHEGKAISLPMNTEFGAFVLLKD
ncbi:MAG: right-handed parallel beta-helix repeat-containing protein [Verrucomicrobia bacterium]|nr:right-handed parallel beta-helix repeat-containing protein [Verrucomicrobiota bacterium]